MTTWLRVYLGRAGPGVDLSLFVPGTRRSTTMRSRNPPNRKRINRRIRVPGAMRSRSPRSEANSGAGAGSRGRFMVCPGCMGSEKEGRGVWRPRGSASAKHTGARQRRGGERASQKEEDGTAPRPARLPALLINSQMCIRAGRCPSISLSLSLSLSPASSPLDPSRTRLCGACRTSGSLSPLPSFLPLCVVLAEPRGAALSPPLLFSARACGALAESRAHSLAPVTGRTSGSPCLHLSSLPSGPRVFGACRTSGSPSLHLFSPPCRPRVFGAGRRIGVSSLLSPPEARERGGRRWHSRTETMQTHGRLSACRPSAGMPSARTPRLSGPLARKPRRCFRAERHGREARPPVTEPAAARGRRALWRPMRSPGRCGRPSGHRSRQGAWS